MYTQHLRLQTKIYSPHLRNPIQNSLLINPKSRGKKPTQSFFSSHRRKHKINTPVHSIKPYRGTKKKADTARPRANTSSRSGRSYNKYVYTHTHAQKEREPREKPLGILRRHGADRVDRSTIPERRRKQHLGAPMRLSINHTG